MNAVLTCVAIYLLMVVSAKALDEDMLLYWRRSGSSKCEPFTTYVIKCNKCVCSADGIPYCTRMACFKGPRFLTDAFDKLITPVNDLNRPGQSEYDGPPPDSV